MPLLFIMFENMSFVALDWHWKKMIVKIKRKAQKYINFYEIDNKIWQDTVVLYLKFTSIYIYIY